MEKNSLWKGRLLQFFYLTLYVVPLIVGIPLHAVIPSALLSIWLIGGGIACGWHTYRNPATYKDAVVYIFQSFLWPYYAMIDLQRRAKEDADSPSYLAFVSGLHVGRLSDTKYAQIALPVRTDLTLYIEQILNLFRAVCRFIAALAVSIVTLLCILAIVCVYYMDINVADASLIAGYYVRHIITWLPYTCIGLFVFSRIIWLKFGFVNVFRREIQRRIKCHMGILSESPVLLIREDHIGKCSPAALKSAGIFMH